MASMKAELLSKDDPRAGALDMQPKLLIPIRRNFSVYLAIVCALMFGQGCKEAIDSDSQTGVVTAPDEVPIHYSISGAGSPALVFVHGISCDQSYWKEQVAPFSQDHLVVNLDLAGHGESGLGRQEWSMEAYGGDVAAVVESLDLQSVVLIGHSMGGIVILKAARRLSGRVRGLVTVDTYEDFSTWYTAEENEEFLQPFREDFDQATDGWIRSMFRDDADPAFVEQIVKDMSAAPPDVVLPSLEAAIEAMYGRERTAVLQELDAPVFVINADNWPTDVESMERDGVEVQIISNTGHFLMMEDPGAFNLALESVIDSLVD
jgi:pimeloyl-ACP methyl ester carboxylesterase